MPTNTRYDQLARLISRDFERARTFTNDAMSANGTDLIVNAADEDWREDNESFANFRPFNALSVTNESTTTIRVHLQSNREWFMDVEAGESRSLDVPQYFRYVELIEQDGNSVSADDVQVTVARHVDGRDLRLLEMSGLLNVGD